MPPHTDINRYYLIRIFIGSAVFSFIFYLQHLSDMLVIIKASKFFLGLAGSYIFIVVACFLNVKIPCISKVLQKYGERTLGIYALDTYIIIAAAMLFKWNIFMYLVALLIDLVGSFIITGLLTRYKITAKYLLGENY